MLPQRESIATIVVCEDDDATLDLLCDHLTADRFEVLPAPSAADALRLCRYNHPDLLLLDLALPDASGLDVLREIREADGVESRFDPYLPIIVLTGRGGATDRVRGLDLGADDYVQKTDVVGCLPHGKRSPLDGAGQSLYGLGVDDGNQPEVG